ncbi:hypothetical protein BTM25_57640 [Actinomadura rubteroloni]|uniref:Uncharacterized protein n=1 Tax=Actinomadura rubteroloni TaxID=1926885 RepID=A0A2P4UBE5_9ACTN|nr:hypothetical protein [Actinomadura rubteroloni]POM22352.1 hypothetical protein BTM25_57640 [Actinomadura rubteroloni]
MRVRGPGAVVGGLALLGALAGCGARSDASVQEAAPPPVATAPSSSPPVTPVPSATPENAADARPGKPLGAPRSWKITTYYTAVESVHHGRPKAVKGCPELHCSHGRTPLGSYPEDFLAVVQMEGAGRLTSGANKGRYLNWSHSVGWWLDDSTRDSRARPLVPWKTAAADRSVLARGQRFLITDCGRDDAGRAVPADVCAAFRRATFTVTDLFRPGYGGQHHADVYVGEETGPGFAAFATTLTGASLAAG